MGWITRSSRSLRLSSRRPTPLFPVWYRSGRQLQVPEVHLDNRLDWSWLIRTTKLSNTPLHSEGHSVSNVSSARHQQAGDGLLCPQEEVFRCCNVTHLGWTQEEDETDHQPLTATDDPNGQGPSVLEDFVEIFIVPRVWYLIVLQQNNGRGCVNGTVLLQGFKIFRRKRLRGQRNNITIESRTVRPERWSTDTM